MTLKRFTFHECGGLVGGTSLCAVLSSHRAESLTFAGGHEPCEVNRIERTATLPASGAKRKTIRPKHSLSLDNSWNSKPHKEI
jgi:hypothetical protein